MLLATAHLLDVLPYGGPHSSSANPGAVIVALIPWVAVSLVHGALVLVTALQRGVNPWVWTVLALIPVVDWVVTSLFFFLTLLSILDRLNALETARPAAAAAPGAAQATWEA